TLRHDAYATGRFDLGNMVQAVWSTAHGHPLRMTDLHGDQISRLAAHVDPILVLFAPLWWLWPSPQLLLVVQALVVAFGAVPVFLLARKHLGSARAGLGFAIAYLLYPALRRRRGIGLLRALRRSRRLRGRNPEDSRDAPPAHRGSGVQLARPALPAPARHAPCRPVPARTARPGCSAPRARDQPSLVDNHPDLDPLSLHGRPHSTARDRHDLRRDAAGAFSRPSRDA